VTLPLAAGPSAYWYTTRGAGVVALLLLTASVVLGVLDLSRWTSDRWPRFMIDGVHRVVSLLAVAVVAVHVLATVLDSFTQIGIRDAFIPFASSYRPIWVGMGALAFDLLLAVAVTSMLRRHIGYRTWRIVHWSAYACWPLALVHGLGSGTDTALPWMVAITLASMAAVLVAAGSRIATIRPEAANLKALAWSGIGTGIIAMVIWAAQGPFASNWAARSGTPKAILTGFSTPTTAVSTARTASSSSASSSSSSLSFPITARLSGHAIQRQAGQGLVDVDIRALLQGSQKGSLEIQILGQPIVGGGVSMTSSKVSVGPPGQPLAYQGTVSALQGSRIAANVSDGQGSTGRLSVQLAIGAGQQVSGTLTAQSTSSGQSG